MLAIRRNPKLFGMTLEIEKESAKKRNNLEIKGPMALSLSSEKPDVHVRTHTRP